MKYPPGLESEQRGRGGAQEPVRAANARVSVVSIVGQFGQGAQLTPTLDGFAIGGGRGDLGGNLGGGLTVRDGNALVRNNVISGNTAYVGGGGVWVQRGAPRLE